MPILTVGPGQTYATLSSAIAASQDGDVIQVQAGTYTNDFAQINTKITIEGVGGIVNLVDTPQVQPDNEKGILVTNTDVTLSNLEFSGAQVGDGNGAGIRYQGGNLTLNNCIFHDNQDGLLANDNPAGSITINNCVFTHNGVGGDGHTHNLYVGEVGTLTVEGSTFTDAVIGHEIKSRALNTIIEDNVIADGPSGTASYSIDLPEGGNATISNNFIEQGPQSENPAIIHYVDQGTTPYAGSNLSINNNTIVNDLTSGEALAVLNQSTVTVGFTDNQVYGLTDAQISNGPIDESAITFLTTEPATPCFAGGTRIRTERGSIAVEALQVGDRVPVALGGKAQPIIWLGHRRIDCSRHPEPQQVWPIRLSAGAFGPGRPFRDLFLSPDHAVYVNGVLIPIRYLVNGRTIRQEPRDAITYWHVELAEHNVLYAEGIPAESYLETGNRSAFANGGAVMDLHADFARRVWETSSCAPLVLSGPKVAAAKRRLHHRLNTFGHRTTNDAGLKLLADGREVFVRRAANTLHVRLLEGTRQVRLLSRVWIPSHMHPDTEDARPLGIAVSHVSLDAEPIGLDEPCFTRGWHAPEQNWRWTNGDAWLAPWGARELAFEVTMTGCYWQNEQNEVFAAQPLWIDIDMGARHYSYTSPTKWERSARSAG